MISLRAVYLIVHGVSLWPASEDGGTCRAVGSITVPLDIDTYVAVSLTSHDNATLAASVR